MVTVSDSAALTTMLCGFSPIPEAGGRATWGPMVESITIYTKYQEPSKIPPPPPLAAFPSPASSKLTFPEHLRFALILLQILGRGYFS